MNHGLKFNSDNSGSRPKQDSFNNISLAPKSALSHDALEFKPSAITQKSLSALAKDFQPGNPRPNITRNLSSEAPEFTFSQETGKFTGKLAEKTPEFVPDKLPDEKFDEPIFIISNRELLESDNDLVLVDDFTKVSVRNTYTLENIFNVYKEIRQLPGFSDISENIKTTSSRSINVYRTKSYKKNKEPLKSEDWRDNDDAEIIATTTWRKPKTEEEEKISQKAKAYKAKLTGTKEEHEKIKRKIKITLNKLSLSNIEKLKEQLLSIGKESSNSLIFLVQCIFEKAWSESKYTNMYAILCKYLKEKFEGVTYPNIETDSGKVKNMFKCELLDRCQHAFSKTPNEEELGTEEEKKKNSKVKTLGNVRFIGELFKVEIITTKVVLSCVHELVNQDNPDEEDLEGACILLSAGGLSFERQKLVKETNQIFKELDFIKDRPEISSRIRFKIMVKNI